MASLADRDIDSDEEENPKVEVEEEEEEEAPEDTSLANSDVVTKYQEASRIVQSVLADVSALVSLLILPLSSNV